MHAIVVDAPGGPEALTYTERPDPRPGPGQALVRVATAGVNFIDVYHREGRYPLPLPLVPGSEGAGIVAEVGDGVTHVAPGDRVAWCSVPGSYAELAVVPEKMLVHVPSGVDLDLAAAAMLQGLTAHYLTHSTYAVRPGDQVLVHAAAGGMGLLLTQLIKLQGGRVIGTVSTEEKEKLARQAGADDVIRYDQTPFPEQVKELTGGRGVDIVYDGVGASTFEGDLQCVRPRALIALFGAASGPVPPFDLQRLSGLGSLFVTRPTLAHYVADRDELLGRAHDLFSWIAGGQLRIQVSQRYPLSQARRAHEDLEGRRTTGKLLLTVRSE
ncbi:quinone oxidoreductase [Hamadaea sp. NPDC050747]|uniref:quinone oxidoreductase family protein n=1 Tax=Hamadaea sp. NPDC050747 TaxID=3155789 RepID=UPI0033CCDBDA